MFFQKDTILNSPTTDPNIIYYKGNKTIPKAGIITLDLFHPTKKLIDLYKFLCAAPRRGNYIPFYVNKIGRYPWHEPIIRSIKRLRWFFFSMEGNPEGDWLLKRNRSRYKTNFSKSSDTRTYRDGPGSGSILNYDTSSPSTWVSTVYSPFLLSDS